MFSELATDLVQDLARVGMLSPEQVAALERSLQQRPDLSASELGTELVTRGLATRFQVDEVLAGRAQRLVRGKYILLDRIRVSPMGVVYRARHPDLAIDVVLKELPGAILATPVAAERFRREVRTLAVLRHPKIVSVFDASLESSPPFLVMEYVAGVNWQELVQDQGPLSLPRAIRLTIAASEALAVVHSQGVVHRDVKPSNLMITKGGEVKLIDFGLARLASWPNGGNEVPDMSGNLVIGTPEYMSPEQCGSGNPVDPRSDIYSLGCTLLFLISGKPPTPDGNLAAKINWHQQGAVPSLRELVPHAPVEADAVLHKMLARDPALRWENCPALLAAWERVAAQMSVEPDETIPFGQVPPAGTPGTAGDTKASADVTPASSSFRISPDERKQVQASGTAQPSRGSGNSRFRLGAVAMAAFAALSLVAGMVAWSLNQRTPAEQSDAGTVKKDNARKQVLLAAANGANSDAADPPAKNLAPGKVNPPGILPPERIPRGVKWNPLVTTHVDPIFTDGSQRRGGRILYSEIDTALEQDCDGEWTIGSELTKDGLFWRVVLKDGGLTSAAIPHADALAANLDARSLQHTIDDHFKLRSQPLIKLEAADRSITSLADGGQRIVLNLLCKPQNNVVFDTAQLSLLYETHPTEFTTNNFGLFANLPWTEPPQGWQSIELIVPVDQVIPPGTVLNFSVTAFVFEPRPSFYRISNTYQTTWKPPAGVASPPNSPDVDK